VTRVPELPPPPPLLPELHPNATNARSNADIAAVTLELALDSNIVVPLLSFGIRGLYRHGCRCWGPLTKPFSVGRRADITDPRSPRLLLSTHWHRSYHFV
jgi:hypothetical protein